jgi:hypothetical protein
MSPHVHVDREKELRLFQHILEGRREERILLVEAPTGLGKTLLMLEYQRLAHQADIPCAMLDLRHVGVAVFEILATLCAEWVDCPFEQFRRQVESLQQPAAHVDLRRIFQIGRPTIQVAMSAPDEATRRERRRLVTEALMADLRGWLRGERRAVMLVDTYNPDLVTPELRQWVEGVLLPHVRRTPGLIAVVAGQEIPPVSVMWEGICCRLRLGPLDNPDDWMDFVEDESIPVDRRTVSAFCHAHKGHPMTLTIALSTLRTWGGEP